MGAMQNIRLTKHHGLGNDFLVYLARGGETPLTAELARALCDRHVGVGADGLIRLVPVLPGPPGVAATMELRNADGSEAEISGNGIRCAGQALVEQMVPPGELVIGTAAGERRLEVGPTDRSGVASVRAEMGRPTIVRDAPEWTGGDVKSALRVDVGNPHLVLVVADALTVDAAHRGAAAEWSEPGGLNVEFVTPGPGAGELTLRTWERGSGETLACGSGSCAAAAAARALGLVGESVVVRNPGGPLEVTFAPDGTATLAGPAQFVAVVTVELERFAAALRPDSEQGGPLSA
jgi:diaminopimelate epimerase